jgi:hypothetical protein
MSQPSFRQVLSIKGDAMKLGWKFLHSHLSIGGATWKFQPTTPVVLSQLCLPDEVQYDGSSEDTVCVRCPVSVWIREEVFRGRRSARVRYKRAASFPMTSGTRGGQSAECILFVLDGGWPQRRS